MIHRHLVWFAWYGEQEILLDGHGDRRRTGPDLAHRPDLTLPMHVFASTPADFPSVLNGQNGFSLSLASFHIGLSPSKNM